MFSRHGNPAHSRRKYHPVHAVPEDDLHGPAISAERRGADLALSVKPVNQRPRSSVPQASGGELEQLYSVGRMRSSEIDLRTSGKTAESRDDEQECAEHDQWGTNLVRWYRNSVFVGVSKADSHWRDVTN